MLTAAGEGPAALVLSLNLRRLDSLELRAQPLAALPGPIQSLEDDLIFEPGDGETPRLVAGRSRTPGNGALLRLSNGDMGLACVETTTSAPRLISLASGEEVQGFDLVFERWSLYLRRGAEVGLVGRFRNEPGLALAARPRHSSGDGAPGGSTG